MGIEQHRCIRRLVASATVALLAVGVTGTSSGVAHAPAVTPLRASGPDVAVAVRIAVALGASQRGTFAVRGALLDSGPARASREVRGNRVRTTMILEGKSGRMVLLVTQTCGSSRSTWIVASGTRDYAGLTGGGKGVGRISCGRSAAHWGTYTGKVATPPPTAIARPGTFSGTGFSANRRMTFDVLPDGRTLTNLTFRQLVARCQPPGVEFPVPRFTGRYPLADNGRFTIAAGGYTVAGKVTGESAKGSIAYEAGGCKSDSMNWNAANPRPPLPAVSPGRYCGFTLQGSGVCLDASGDAWVTRVRFEVTLRCTAPEATSFAFEYAYEGALGVTSDLTFAGSLGNVPLAGGGSLRFSVSGTFDGAEHISGKGGISDVRVVKDGTLYTCRNAVSSFTATRGA